MQKRFNDLEIAKIRAMFPTEAEMKLVRKVFLPELTQDAPISGNETLLSYIKTQDMTAEEIAVETKSVMKLISHIEGALNMLLNLTANAPQSDGEVTAKKLKDSLK